MPRKVAKTEKPPLQFLERPLSGARLQNVPEVRAAINPREFFSQTHSTSALTSWVDPQFDISSTSGPLLKRRRRKCQSVTRIVDTCNEFSRKTVCKYPRLSFHGAQRDNSHNPSGHRAKKAAEVTSKPNQPQGSRQSKRTNSPAPKRRRNPPKSSARAPNEHLNQTDNQVEEVTEESRTPPGGCSTPGPPPDVDTPTMRQERNSCPMSPRVCSLLAQHSSPKHHPHPDILVSDTPESDYGVKVTWRRRKSLMMMLKERGLLD
ncbi:hypothetical protein FQA47_016509 [Oryzias melastigma]|uniref:Uncharacterized protein n=1 Tax=Oryzias melastigma TaxID=30732 RepID=A0A834FLZ7_ORYME|nr:hypothetical protein FQA47_016509 [Oryzias melastigma]